MLLDNPFILIWMGLLYVILLQLILTLIQTRMCDFSHVEEYDATYSLCMN